MIASQPECIVVGGSAGSIEVLNTLLPALPADFALPIVSVIHQPEDGPGLLPQLFEHKCLVRVREVEHGQPISPGVFFGPPGYHLAVEPERTLSLSLDPEVWFSRPSIDVLFDSAAWTFGGGVLAILLSGANEDGARGLAGILAAGGSAWVQDPSTAFVKTMPEAGLRLGKGHEVLSPGQMAARLCSFVTVAT